MTSQTSGSVRVAVDETCPSCRHPETWADVVPAAPVTDVIARGCNKCGWRKAASS